MSMEGYSSDLKAISRRAERLLWTELSEVVK